MSERDIDKNPYSKDEARVAAYFFERGCGGGDDPIGAILASHSYVVEQRNLLREALYLARRDMKEAITHIDKELKECP